MWIILDGWHMMDWGHMNWGSYPFFGLLFIGIIVGIGLILVYIIINSEKKEDVEVMSDAQKVLDERYAKGEISRSEYLQAKDDLTNFKPK
jgi:uncharacterized membrane protein